MSELKSTPLTKWHRSHGARMVPFADFEMPVQYKNGIQEEVRCVRNEVGLFDLCHMGRLVLTGPDRVAAADRVLTQNVGKLKEGMIRYGLITTPDGTVIDDVLIYKGTDEVHVVINASGREADDAWFREQTASFDVEIQNVSDDQAMIALQGPNSKAILPAVCDVDLTALKYYRYTTGKLLDGIDALVSRTGYTGEDGFELFFPKEHAVSVWDALLAAGHGVQPIGLGARDICRTEAGMPLYGHELSREITPLEAGVMFGVDLEKDFIGRDPLVAMKEAGVPRALIGLNISGKRVPREGCAVSLDGKAIGVVTSGTFSPTLERPIAMALVSADAATEGLALEVDVRGRPVGATVDGLPFYSRKRKKSSPGKS